MTSHAPRIDYDGDGLTEAQLPDAPWAIVLDWVEQARRAQAEQSLAPEPDALSVATVDGAGQPHVRTVLMRYLEVDGPGFYGGLHSRKGRDIAENPRVAAALTWPALFHAVRFVGTAVELPRDVVHDYFTSRPWGSRVGAWVSDQSQPMADRSLLETKDSELQNRWPDTGSPDDVPLPDAWGGWRIDCSEIELWAGRRSRLHDRLVYVRTADGGLDDPAAWRVERRQP